MRVEHVTTSDMSLRFLLLDQMRYLRDNGFDVSGVSAAGPWISEVRAAGIPVTPIPLTRRITPAADLRALATLYAQFQRTKPDIVHTHTPKAGLLGQWAALAAGVPHRVHTIHGLYLPGGSASRRLGFYKLLERATLRPPHLVFSQNREDIDTCIRDGLCPKRKLVHLGNGIDLNVFHPRNHEPSTVEEARAAERIAPRSTVIGMVGRLTEEKGYRDYFAAARMVLAEEDDVIFLAIGPFEPEKADAIEQGEIDALGLGERLRVLGHRADVARLYGAMDIFVLPSHREGFPRAPMEAAATGLPVLVSDERGCRETVIDGASGFLLPQRDPRALANAMLRLIRDKPLRERLGARGRTLAEERFDQRKVFSKIARGYEALLENKPVASEPG